MDTNANLDLITNSEVGNQMQVNGRIDVGRFRPFVHNGNTYISVYKGGDVKKNESYEVIQVNTTGTLRRDEWKALDEAVLGIAESRLTGVQGIINKGLVFNLGNGFGTTVLESHDVSDALEAELSMDGVTRGKNDRQVFGTTYLPIPLIHADYEINSRVLAASRNMGNGLDTYMAERAARKVAEKLEGMLFTDTTYTFGGGTIYSFLNHPNRNTVSLGTSWVTETGANIIAKVLSFKQAAIDDNFYGPYTLYIPTAYETALDRDYDSTTPGTTIRERILKISNITDIVVNDTLPTGNVVLAQMTSDVVRIVRGMGIQNVQWQTEGNFINKYKVMTIQVPQIRADQNGKSGIVHAS